METTITSSETIRTLSRVVSTATKLSDTIQLTSHATHFTLRALNATQSATILAHIRHTCAPYAKPLVLPTRVLQHVLRAPTTLTAVHLSFHPPSLCVHTRAAVRKTFVLPLVDARVPRVQLPLHTHRIVASPPFLLDLLSNFHARLDEITLIPSPDHLRIVSCVDQHLAASFLRTELTVPQSQLDHLSVSHPVRLTIFCRPLRAALEFAAAFDHSVVLRFAQPGDPVVMEVPLSSEHPQSTHATFVFATRLVDDNAPRNNNTALPTTLNINHTDDADDSYATAQNNLPHSSDVVEATQVVYSSSAPREPPHRRSSVFDDPLLTLPRSPEAQQNNSNTNTNNGTRHLDDDEDDFVEGTPPPDT